MPRITSFTLVYFVKYFEIFLLELMATNFSPSSGSYVLNKFPSISQWSDSGPSWPSCFFLHSVYYPFKELSTIFIKFRIVVCKVFQVASLKFVVRERVNFYFNLGQFFDTVSIIGTRQNQEFQSIWNSLIFRYCETMYPESFNKLLFPPNPY